MKHIRLFILAITVLLTPKGVCQDLDQDCCFEFAAEWLYMLSAIDQPYYAIQNGAGATLFNGNRVANSQDWHSGYRLEAVYRFDCLDRIRVRWTSFNNFSDSDAINALNSAILNHPSTSPLNANDYASIQDTYRFYYLDVLYDRFLISCCPFFLGFQAGVQYAHLDMNEDVNYREITGNFLIENQSRLRGVGPEIGFNMGYALFNCLEVKGRASSTLLISQKEAKSREVTSTGALLYSAKNDKYWLATPVFNMRFGLSYDYSINCCFCFDLNLEVGYEINHFIKGVDRIYFVDGDNNGSSFTEQMDFTLHGPYVHLGICF